jgi:hypothetical protein
MADRRVLGTLPTAEQVAMLARIHHVLADKPAAKPARLRRVPTAKRA